MWYDLTISIFWNIFMYQYCVIDCYFIGFIFGLIGMLHDLCSWYPNGARIVLVSNDNGEKFEPVPPYDPFYIYFGWDSGWTFGIVSILGFGLLQRSIL
eukprot:UN29794